MSNPAREVKESERGWYHVWSKVYSDKPEMRHRGMQYMSPFSVHCWFDANHAYKLCDVPEPTVEEFEAMIFTERMWG